MELVFGNSVRNELNKHLRSNTELTMFQVNPNVFKANINVFLKNLETQVGQFALAMQNQSKDSFPSGTKKSPKDCMDVALRSGKELKNIEEVEKKRIEVEIQKADQNSAANENEKSKTGLSNEIDKMKEQGEVAKEEKGQKVEVRGYQPHIPFPQRLKQSKLDN